MELVKCAKCAEEKPRDAFHPYKRNANGLQSYCKECKKGHYRKAYDPEKSRWRSLKSAYGISKEAFMARWDAQGGCCDICRTALSLEIKFGYATDHNHETGEVRGLLCKPCNRALGLFKDSPSRLRDAAAYLERVGHYGQGN
jgi:hypothetical protein